MMRLFSPAKINLFLRIVSKRSDGYHDLSSVFQTVTLGDTLIIKAAENDQLMCSDPFLPIDSSNLVLKAVNLFRAKTGIKQAYHIQLIKRIPLQAGLGGGSSNAATVLWACNQLNQTEISLNTLKQWGSELGSDVPFFLSQGTAYCTGRGECVHHLPAMASRSLWIVKPQEGLSTPEVYRRLKLTSSFEQKARMDLDAFLTGSLPYFNDLEEPAFEANPSLKQLKKSLLELGFESVVMSGSGSAFFCMGQAQKPFFQNDLSIYPVQYINRTLSNWYQEPIHYKNE